MDGLRYRYSSSRPYERAIGTTTLSRAHACRQTCVRHNLNASYQSCGEDPPSSACAATRLYRSTVHSHKWNIGVKPWENAGNHKQYPVIAKEVPEDLQQTGKLSVCILQSTDSESSAKLEHLWLTWKESAMGLSLLLKSRMAAFAPGLSTLFSSWRALGMLATLRRP